LGLMFMAVIIFLPGGLVELGQRVAKLLKKRQEGETNPQKEPAE
jgi:hypothetical protein